MTAATTMAAPRLGLPHLGLGVGLRPQHYQHILEHGAQVDWFEIISENFIDNHGYGRHVLDTVAAQVPIVMHGVSLSIGSSDPLDMTYLRQAAPAGRRAATRVGVGPSVLDWRRLGQQPRPAADAAR